MKNSDIVEAAKPYGSRFQRWLAFQLSWESDVDRNGNIRVEDVPGDNGQKTFSGVDYASHPNFDYNNPKAAEVARIYKEGYWDQVVADTLGFPVGEVVANYAVNMGKRAAVKLLQYGINSLKPESVVTDGILGPKTVHAALESNHEKLADLIEDAADDRYRGIVANNPSQRKFLAGWLNRNAALEKWWMSLPRV